MFLHSNEIYIESAFYDLCLFIRVTSSDELEKKLILWPIENHILKHFTEVMQVSNAKVLANSWLKNLEKFGAILVTGLWKTARKSCWAADWNTSVHSKWRLKESDQKFHNRGHLPQIAACCIRFSTKQYVTLDSELWDKL